MQAKTLSIGVLPAGAVTAKTDPVTGGSVSLANGEDQLFSAQTAASGMDGRPYPAFCDAAEWSKYSTGTGTAAETTNAEYGRVLRISATAAGAKYGIGRDMVIDASSPVAFSFLAKKDTNLSALDVEIGFAQFGFTKCTRLNKGVSNMGAGEWQRISFSLAEYEARGGSPTAEDRKDIRCIRISVTPSASNTTVLEIADFRVHRAVPGGVVGIFFDDGRLDTYTVAYQEMRSRGMVGSIAVEYQTVGNADRCSQTQLNEMYAAGWGMCAHHTASFSAMSDADQVTHHKGMRDYLAANNFKRGNHIFVYPGGQRNASTDKIARGYWQVTRAVSAMTQIATPGAFDTVRPPHVYITNTTTLTQAKAKIDQVKADGGSVIFVFHSIVDVAAAAEDWLRTDFIALLDYIQAQGVLVTSCSDIWTKKAQHTAF